MDSLKATTLRVMSTANQNHLNRACSGFRSHIEAVFEAEDVFVFTNITEKKIYFYLPNIVLIN